jgi:antitoxin component YwqK of YwqJK toxin-antitoxin module
MNIKILLLFLLSIALKSGYSQNLFQDEFEIRDSIAYVDGKLYTGMHQFFKDGILIETAYFKNGIIDSTSIFNKKGELITQIFFENKIEVRWREYKTTLFAKYIINYNYKNHEYDGLWECYTFKGELLERRYYNNGKPVGKWVMYDSKGHLMMETFFDENPIVEKTYEIHNKKQTVTIKYIDKNTLKVLRKTHQ